METKNMTTGQSGEVTPHPYYPGQDSLEKGMLNQEQDESRGKQKCR